MTATRGTTMATGDTKRRLEDIKGQHNNGRHNGGDGRHDNGNGQQGDRWHDDDNERHDDAEKRRQWATR
jgi:hypothetical protein